MCLISDVCLIVIRVYGRCTKFKATLVCPIKLFPAISFMNCNWLVTMELQISFKNLRYFLQYATQVVPQLLHVTMVSFSSLKQNNTARKQDATSLRSGWTRGMPAVHDVHTVVKVSNVC